MTEDPIAGSAAPSGRSAAHRFPVSVKGVVLDPADRVLLLRNERDEWELPGGKLEPAESPETCLAREILEEASWRVTITAILDSWVYHIAPGADVLIVTYGCELTTDRPPQVSHEHEEAALFSEREVAGLRMPDGYKRSIAEWFSRRHDRAPQREDGRRSQ